MERRPRKKRKAVYVLLVLALMLAVCVYDSNTRLVTDEFLLGDETLPTDLEGVRITQLSDLHAKRYGKGNGELIEAVRATDPDLICVTGDLVDGEQAKQEPYVRELMGELVRIAPVYYVSGNHEWAAGWARELFSILREYGVTVLRNEYVTYGRGSDYIVIAGMDDPNGLRDQKTPERVVEEIREDHPGKYILMLYHRDTELALWAGLGVNAVLCGHAHGGLVRLPFTDGLIAPGQGFFPTWTAGIYERDGTQMLVSRGLAGSHLVPRLFNNPEIVSVTLSRHAKTE